RARHDYQAVAGRTARLERGARCARAGDAAAVRGCARGIPLPTAGEAPPRTALLHPGAGPGAAQHRPEICRASGCSRQAPEDPARADGVHPHAEPRAARASDAAGPGSEGQVTRGSSRLYPTITSTTAVTITTAAKPMRGVSGSPATMAPSSTAITGLT